MYNSFRRRGPISVCQLLFNYIFLLFICSLYGCNVNGQWLNNNRIQKNLNELDGNRFDAAIQISVGSEKFALEFLKQLSAELSPREMNFICSPFSVWSLLTLIAEGAAGNTYDELQRTLGLPQDLSAIRQTYSTIHRSLRINTTTIDLALSQGLFTNKNRPVYRNFEDKLTKTYEADVVSVDFNEQAKAFLLINEFVYRKTMGKITKVITMDDLIDAQMILISAIYFKGQWTFPFDRSSTKIEPFYNEAGKIIGNVSMMYQKEVFPYAPIAELNAFVLKLPYGKENRLSMLLILPRRGTPLTTVLEKLPQVGTRTILNGLMATMADYGDDDVEVYLPRFSISSEFIMNSILEKMKLVDIFDVKKADLSNMSQYKPVLSKIVHHAKIDVNEEGTIASAASSASFVNKNSPPKFYANKPFAYLIMEKTTNIILFCGEVRNPTLI